MFPKIEGLELTPEQIAQYIAIVNAEGKKRQKNFGKKDAVAFAMGAAVLLFAIGRANEIPAVWVLGPMMDKSPFGE